MLRQAFCDVDDPSVLLRPIRVGFDLRWITPEPSGIGVYSRELVRGLAQVDSYNEYQLMFSRVELCDQVTSELGLTGVPNFSTQVLPFGTLGLANQILAPRFLRRANLDVYHTPNYMLPLPAFPRGRGRRMRCVVTIHDVIPMILSDTERKSTKGKVYPLYRQLMLEVARRADVILTVSHSSKRDIVRALRIPPSRLQAVRVVYNGLAERFIAKSKECRDDHTTGDKRVVLFVGRQNPYKGVVTLVEALALLRSRCAFPVELTLAGALDSRYTEGHTTARKLGVDGAVRWTGAVDDEQLMKLYREADVFVLPSHYEGFGLPVLEAMACGVPVVCSSVSALPEVAGDAAFYVNPGDRMALADAIQLVLTSRSERNRMVKKGLARAGQFTWVRAARETLAVYRELACQNPSCVSG